LPEFQPQVLDSLRQPLETGPTTASSIRPGFSSSRR
jgi:predicted ATPase with chaperone activity